MSHDIEDRNRRLLRARDAIDRSYADPLDIPTLARIALVSEAHFIRTFKATFGESPHRYLQRRRVELTQPRPRDRPVEVLLARAVDDAEAALADLLQHPVAGDVLGHGQGDPSGRSSGSRRGRDHSMSCGRGRFPRKGTA